MELENPLDILTRAATMVETGTDFRENSIRHEMENRDSPGKELPTKTQRQMRSHSRQGMLEQLNFDEDHQNKVNSKKCTYTQTAGTQTSYNFDKYEEVRKQLNQSVPPESSQNSHATDKPTTTLQDMPLNLTMSIQDDAQNIPTYTQLRPSVIMCAPNMPPLSPGGSTGSSIPSSPSPTSPNGPSKQEANSAGICDPAIDEHFRRSLGKNYPAPPEYSPTPASLPNSSNPSQSNPEVSVSGSVDDHFAKSLGQKWTEIKAKNDNLDLDISIGSVDDHFAKALGDTWHKIKAQHDGCKNSACSSPPSSPASSVVST